MPFFSLPACSFISIFTGFLCGFPMGAKTINMLYESSKITKREASTLLKFTNNCNPAFILSTIGISLFSSIKNGIIILFSHYTSALIIGIISGYFDNKLIIHENACKLKSFTGKKHNLDKKKNLNIMEKIKLGILSTFKTMALIFGFMVIFNLLFSLLSTLLDLFNVSYNIKAIIHSLFEMTTGAKNIYSSSFPLNLKISLVSFALGFSSFSIIAQIYSSVSMHGFSIKSIIKFKFIHGILSFLITYTLLNIKNTISINITNILLILVFIFLLCMLVYTIKNKNKKIKQ